MGITWDGRMIGEIVEIVGMVGAMADNENDWR